HCRGAPLTAELFPETRRCHRIAAGAVLLGGWAQSQALALKAGVDAVIASAPWRHMQTPGGRAMSTANSNCGPLGWQSDALGYRYLRTDPESGRAWPAMPAVFWSLAVAAAEEAGYPGFAPDACLLNRYAPGARLSLHRDQDERDAAAPIVSVSLGLPATFLFGGARREDPCHRLPLYHGDVVVWGGPTRFHYHGVLPVPDGHHPLVGRFRINLTFRKVR
ncbi:DNA oxidative demethylase AlkB, partial [Algiphilus sp.]